LKLVAELKSGKTIEAGTNPWIVLSLANTSASVTYPVVKPGDGTCFGWRDPYVYFTAERLAADGRWVPVERAPFIRCGIFDENWPKDVVDLKPGERLALEHPCTIPLDFQRPGRVRMVGHYAYRATGGKRGGPRPEDLRGRMAGVPLFEVTSEPVEFEVIRPLDVRIRVKRPMKAQVEQRLSDVMDVIVVNLTSGEVPFAGTVVWLDLKGTYAGWRPSYREASGASNSFSGWYRKPSATLPAGGEVSLFGPDRVDGTWTYPVAETIRVRAVIHTQSGQSLAEVRSEWVEVQIEK
jgi:hypothetical protein